MAVNTFPPDQMRLKQELQQLPESSRLLFALACAQRLYPAYVQFSKKTGSGDPAKLSTILERLWRDAGGEAISPGQLQADIDACMGLIPDEDDQPWVIEQATAEDAATALAYALRYRQSGDLQEAAWASKRVFDALDHFITNQDWDDSGTAKVGLLSHAQVKAQLEAVGAHPLVQAEQRRQARDLEELRAGNPSVLAARMKSQAEEEAGLLFGT
jgi:uncharacterized protein YjaG (DUF416 family)